MLTELFNDMVVLDWVLLVLVVVFAVIGYAHGFVAGVLSLGGFVGGAVLALIFVPRLLGGFTPGLGTALVAVLLVLLAAALGQWMLGSLGEAIRRRFDAPAARRVDGFAGALVGIAGFLVVAWFVGAAVSSAAIPNISAQARNSLILSTVDDSVPYSPDALREDFRDVVASAGFPEVVAPFVEETVPPAPAPETDVLASGEVREALPAVVRVSGEAGQCGTSVEATGSVVGNQRVMTNAHVVAGTDALLVTGTGGVPLAASVIYFDPDIDVAVLDVPDLDAPPLPLQPEVEAGASMVVVGYPGGGRLRQEPARVRGEMEVLGLDIYGEQTVLRDVVSLRSDVRPGNSGGPLLNKDGQMSGLIFAASLTTQDTGYALAVSSLAEALAAAEGGAAEPVSTGRCA